MMIIRNTCSVVLALLSVSLIAAVTAESPYLKTWTLYHSLDGGREFVRRGQIRLGKAASEGDGKTEGGLELTIQQHDDENEDKMTTESIQKIIGVGLYQLKLVEDGNEANAVMTSVPACHLRRANFRDEIGLVLNPHGQAISLNYIPLQSPLAPSCQELAEINSTTPTPVKFKSKISFETSTPGMTLKTVLPMSKPPPGLKFFTKTGGIPGQPVDNKDSPTSIFQRYWYVFVIFIVLQLLGVGSEPAAAPPPPAPGAAVAGSANRAGAAAPQQAARGAPQAPSPPAAATTNAQRRGKRD